MVEAGYSPKTRRGRSAGAGRNTRKGRAVILVVSKTLTYMKKKKDRRIWGATEVNGVVARQNPDRHDPNKKAEREAYLAEWWRRYIADAPYRRAATTQQVWEKCWQSKATDGSDGLGGFTPDNRSASGWTKFCKMCRAKIARERRSSKKAATGQSADAIAEDV